MGGNPGRIPPIQGGGSSITVARVMHPSKLVPILWISCLRKMCIGQRICH